MTRRFEIVAKPLTLRRIAAALIMAAAAATPVAPARARAARQQPGAARGLGAEIRIKIEDGSVVKLYERSYALVIGVSDYAAGWPRLPGVKKDVEAVTRALQRHGFEVTVVENPDSFQLDKSFKTFIDEHGANVENRLLFYFAGHGHTARQSYGEEMGYIVPADAPLPGRDARGFMSKALDMQQMELYARRIQSKHALFLFDSCFSGSLFALSRAVPEIISYKTARPVRQFITSGDADETVPDKSVFREQFVAALDGEADLNRDGYVTGTELGEFLQDKVVNYTRNAQHPQYGKIRNPNLDKGDFVFALPGARPSPAATGATPANSGATAVDAATTAERNYWELIQDSADANDFRAYLKKYPQGRFASEARLKISQADAAALAKRQGEAPTVPSVRPLRANGKSGRVLLLIDERQAESTSDDERRRTGTFLRKVSAKLMSGGVNLTFGHSASDDRARRMLSKLQSGDKTAAKDIPYPLVIVGDYQVKELSQYGGLYAAEASATLRAIDGDTGAVVAQALIPAARGFGNTPGQAEDNALAKAAESIPAKFIEQVAAAAR